MSFPKKGLYLVVAIGVILFLNYWLSSGIGPYEPPIGEYPFRILMLIGINIILAVSLNLINGLAGQFSIGHAGFMAVGGYAAAYVTCYLFYAIYGDDAPRMVSGG